LPTRYAREARQLAKFDQRPAAQIPDGLFILRLIQHLLSRLRSSAAPEGLASKGSLRRNPNPIQETTAYAKALTRPL
jgi:hypothetical protein